MKNEVKIMKKIIIKGLSAILCAGMVFLSACSTQTNDDTSKENGNTAADSQQSYVTVTFDSNGGSAVNEIKVKKGDTLTLPEEPVKDGYVFCGWNTSPEAEAWVDTIDFSMYRIDADVTLHAIWGNEDYDLDEDGLSHKDEIAYSTDPDLYDTDKDGISDGDEVNKYHTIPSSDDSDGDTLLDGFEVAVGLNPLEKQSDGKTNDADKSISYTFSESDDGYSLTIEGNTKMMSSISTSTFDKSIANNSNNIISDIISIEKDSSDPFESADLVYSYKNDSLGSLSEDDLSILYLNEDTGKYEVVSSVINKANMTISAKLSHFSKYAIGGLSLANSNHLLSTKSITYNGKTIKAVEVADSGFDLFRDSFAFHNFINDAVGGFCYGFTWVTYLNYLEKLPVSGESFTGINKTDILSYPSYDISKSTRFNGNSLYREDEAQLFNKDNHYKLENVSLSDSEREAVTCIQHWLGKQHGFADRFVTPDVAEKNRYKKILIEKLQSGEPVPLTLYEWSLGTNVHSVLAYKMYETNDADYILVYDSNFPGEERYIKISSFFSIFTGAEYKMGSYSYSVVKISYVPIPDGPYVSHTGTADEESSTVSTPTNENTEEDWKSIYKAKLQEKANQYSGSEYDAKFELVDIDQNGIPELFISPSEFRVSACEVYTICDGNIKQLQVSTMYGGLHYNSKEKIIGDVHIYNFGSTVLYWVAKLENGDIKVIYSSDAHDDTFTVNGENVTLEEYKAANAKYPIQGGEDWKFVGRKHSLNSSEINTVLGSHTETAEEESSKEKKATDNHDEIGYLQEYYDKMEKSGDSRETLDSDGDFYRDLSWAISNHTIKDYNGDGHPELVVQYSVKDKGIEYAEPEGKKLEIISYRNGEYKHYQFTDGYMEYITPAGGEAVGNYDELFVDDNNNLSIFHVQTSVGLTTVYRISTCCINNGKTEEKHIWSVFYSNEIPDYLSGYYDDTGKLYYVDNIDTDYPSFGIISFYEYKNFTDKSGEQINLNTAKDYCNKTVNVNFVDDFRVSQKVSHDEFLDITKWNFCSKEEFKSEYLKAYPDVAKYYS